MMLEYEKRTGRKSTRFTTDGIYGNMFEVREVRHYDYIDWLEETVKEKLDEN